MSDQGDICPHLNSIGEVTKEELLQKSKVSMNGFKRDLLGQTSGLCMGLDAICDKSCMSFSFESHLLDLPSQKVNIF